MQGEQLLTHCACTRWTSPNVLLSANGFSLNYRAYLLHNLGPMAIVIIHSAVFCNLLQLLQVTSFDCKLHVICVKFLARHSFH